MTTSDVETHFFPTSTRAPARGELGSGSSVGEYVIERLVAQGGCGTVYLARHGTLGRKAAIKVLHESLASSPRMVERFVREVEVVNLLRHPNIVEIYELGQLTDGRPYYAMEYLAGMTVDALLRGQGRLSPAEALEILEPVAAALEAAHEAGIIHRDVKASNIAVFEGGPTRAVKLLDFGIAKLAAPELGASGLTSVGRQLGTPSAMAPEQILGEPIDARIDIYALGILLYRMLTGRLPFYSTNQGELARLHLEEPAPRPSLVVAIPSALDAVVLRCLEKRPERRFESAQSFIAALRDAVGRPHGRGDDARTDAAVSAAAIHLELRMNIVSDEIDDALADDLGTILDLAEDALRREGFLLTLVTGSAILGVRPLPADDPSGRSRRAAVEVAASLFDELARRPGADDRIDVAVSVHVDQAIVRRAARPEVVGGPIVRAGAWSAGSGSRGVFVTPEAIAGISGFTLVPGPRRLLMLAARAPAAASTVAAELLGAPVDEGRPRMRVAPMPDFGDGDTLVAGRDPDLTRS